MDPNDGIKRSADFSPCRTWRYTLIREWGPLPRVVFILLNPSTADEKQDDPTNRRGIDFAKRWGYGSVVFVNLFAIRSPNPATIKEVEDPIGPQNDCYIDREVRRADLVVCAWGCHGSYGSRNDRVMENLRVPVHCLGVTKDGHPKHPLYLKATTEPIEFKGVRNGSG